MSSLLLLPSPGLAGISTPESLPDITPRFSPVDPKLLDDDGLVLDDVLLDAAEGGLPFPCLNNKLLEPGLDLQVEIA